jgi:hypothetical protein
MLQGTGGQIAAALLVLVGAGALYYFVFAGDGMSAVADESSNIWYVDEGGKAFKHKLTVGESAVVKSSDGKRAWPAELCFWTKDGKAKGEPTPVLLNENLGKSEATFCPDCGRLVVGRNPPPAEGVKPPPTKTEYSTKKN